MRKNRDIYRIISVFVLAGVVAACAPAAAPQPQTAARSPSAAEQPPATAFQKILEGAKAEGKVVYWPNTPARDETMQALLDAFKKRYGFSIEVDHLKLQASDITSRAIAERAAGRTSGDIVNGSAAQFISMIEAGAVAKTDWIGIFGKEFPGIESRGETFVPSIKGYGLALQHTTYCLEYNTKQMKKENLPTRWEDLASPKWKGQFAIDARGWPWALFAHDPEWGEEKVTRLVQQLLANEPMIVPVSRGEEVARGEVPLQTQIIHLVWAQQKQGAPVDCALLDPVPMVPIFIGVAEGAAHPNAARLFLAWALTEGLPIMEQEYVGGLLTDPNSRLGKLGKEINFRIATERTPEDVKKTAAVLKRFAQLITQVRR